MVEEKGSGAQPRTRVAILGGGTGALTTAFYLTETEALRRRFEVTIYQMGWRLGGKGASGRNMTSGYGRRIEEHGLHLWMGGYHNAFRMLRAAYQEQAPLLPEGAPLADIEEAFKPHSLTYLEEQRPEGFVHWPIDYPAAPGRPGTGEAQLTIGQHLLRLLDWMQAILYQGVLSNTDTHLRGRLRLDLDLRLPSALRAPIESLIGAGDRSLDRLARAILGQLIELIERLPGSHTQIADLLRLYRKLIRRLLESRLEHDPFARRLWILHDIGLTNLIAIFAEGVLQRGRGLDELDRYDWQEMMALYGLSDEARWSPPIRGIYDLLFAFRNGVAEADHAQLGAGSAARGVLRMFFGYKGAVFYKMQAGMGDVVFTPLYRVLSHRGVRFEFFHRVEELLPDSDGRLIEAVRLRRQATPSSGRYQPLVEVDGIDCWPSAPLYDQLIEGELLQQRGIDLESSSSEWAGAGELTLQIGEHFDRVVLATSLAPIPTICRRLIELQPRWREMIRRVPTVATQSAQIWFSASLDGLGWRTQPAPENNHEDRRPLMTSFEEPLDTWCDMSQLLLRENWHTGDPPQQLSYFCGPLAESPWSAEAESEAAATTPLDQVRANVTRLIDGNAQLLWPHAYGEHGLYWELLVDPEERDGKQRLAAQWMSANTEGSARYVQSPPGSVEYRLPADGSGVDNLLLAGDWVRNGLNVGCVESAVMGGMQAARALRGDALDVAGEEDFPLL